MRALIHNLFLFALAIFSCFESSGQSNIIGKWKTIDDDSGEPRSVVEIYQKGETYFGKVIQIFTKQGEDADPICDVCEDDRKNQKVIGMEIIRDMEFDAKSNVYEEGTILDPENGNLYDCKIWVEDETLKVRGYLYFLYRTQTWLPYHD